MNNKRKIALASLLFWMLYFEIIYNLFFTWLLGISWIMAQIGAVASSLLMIVFTLGSQNKDE
ncbi:hypothetical protein EBR43_04885 [bacterium]|nr:hypothetical protein [bacterium]